MPLTVDIFSAGYEPVDPGPGWDHRIAATWPASTAILVDALMTTQQGEALTSWITGHGCTVGRVLSPTATAITSSAPVPSCRPIPRPGCSP